MFSKLFKCNPTKPTFVANNRHEDCTEQFSYQGDAEDSLGISQKGLSLITLELKIYVSVHTCTHICLHG